MKALTLHQTNVAQGEQQQATCGRSLSSNYAPPNLENKLLTSTLMPKPSSLQPSFLSSTSSSLLSPSSFSPSFTSPLLSTENKLLTGHSALPKCFAPSFLPPPLGGEQSREDGGDEATEESPEYSEEDNVLSEEQEVEDDGTAMEIPVLGIELDSQELEQTMVIKQEEFAEIDRVKENIEEELKDNKYLLLNLVCCSLVNKSKAPGQKDWDSEESVWTKIKNLAKDISDSDPQFLLKVAVYTRQELNIRITANFLLALAANQPSTKPHVRRYFCAAVQLPSDWLEVVRIYSTCFSRSLPMCLKKAMADKFKQFNEYQLAKYNTRKHRCKHNRNKQNVKKPTAQQMKKWANLLRADTALLEKILNVKNGKAVVDKKQSEFSIKKMIKKLHIKEPAEYVMAILGKKYPADANIFNRSGIKGSWDREKAGKRMKLKEPETWERLLSREGNKAATWEKLIDNKSVPFMAMLRNLRNMITAGISEAHHKKILSRLTNKKAVIQSRQFPMRFLAAYKVIMEMNSLASEKVIPPVKEILKGILKNIPKSKRFESQDWDTTPKSRLRVTLGVPFIYRLYKMKKEQLLKANQSQVTLALLDRYRKALETAVQISCRFNVPPLPGRTLILLSCDIPEDREWHKKPDFCLPEEEEEENEEEEEEKEEEEEQKSRRRKREKPPVDKLTASVMETAALLSLMIGSSAEDSQITLVSYSGFKEVELKSDVLLDNVRSVIKQRKVDNIIVLCDCWTSAELKWAIKSYRNEINHKALIVEILLTERESEFSPERNYVKLAGFSEQILRFVAERGSSRLLEHVEHLDKMYNVPPPEGAKGPQTADNVVQIPASPKSRTKSEQ
ncbi:hypothetical protein F7725_011140 [Dissostichus mawsoni]|uniref:TROVE domain-containing protein n=1 Tax=Dissostichus mawsoni TaxID=36200 RepID=A0A7J5ZA68_DISMA|nr:hypothetical protein F7725_011140 [Dissostichus mawsoni]